MDSFIFDAWRVEIKPQKNKEVMYFYFLRTIEEKEWVDAISGKQVNNGRIKYEMDYVFFKKYREYFDHEEVEMLTTKRAVYGWLDRMSHYGDSRNTSFLKTKITEEHLNGSIDEALVNNFFIHVSCHSLSMKLWNGCSAFLVDPTKPKEWISFLRAHNIKVGHTIFFIYCGLRDYATVIFDRKPRLSLYDNKNGLPKDIEKKGFFDSDTETETDDAEEDTEEEDSMGSAGNEETDDEEKEDEIGDDDIELCSGDDSSLPTLEQMDATAREVDSIPLPSSHSYSAYSSDADSVKSF